jgi:hypothetical protein
MSKYRRPHRHERRQQHAVKMRLETLKAESDFAPNKPRTKSIVTVESTHKSKLGAQHVRKQLRRSPTFHKGVVITVDGVDVPVDTTVGIKDNPQPFTQLPNTFTLTDIERAKLETMTMPTKAKQLRLIPMLANFGYVKGEFPTVTIPWIEPKPQGMELALLRINLKPDYQNDIEILNSINIH